MAAGLDKAAIDKLVETQMKDGTVVDITADNDWFVNQYCLFYIVFAAIACCGIPIVVASQSQGIGALVGVGACGAVCWSFVIFIMILVSRNSSAGKTCAGDFLTENYGDDLAKFPAE